jgi:hypothetical protein
VSYDLYAIPVASGQSAEAAWNAKMDAEEEDWPRELTDEEARSVDELAALLVPLGLERFEFDYAAIASTSGIDEAEARRLYRHAELNSPDDDVPVQITLDGRSAAANVPYWHDDERARRTYELIFQAFRIVTDRTGWRVFDSQLEREIDLQSDLDAVLEKHAEGVGHVREIEKIVDEAEDEDQIDELLRARGYSVGEVEGDAKPHAPRWQFWRR